MSSTTQQEVDMCHQQHIKLLFADSFIVLIYQRNEKPRRTAILAVPLAVSRMLGLLRSR